MSEEEHVIKIKALHELHGEFDKEQIGTDYQMALDTHKEVSISFKCSCDQKFYKRERAEEHLEEV